MTLSRRLAGWALIGVCTSACASGRAAGPAASAPTPPSASAPAAANRPAEVARPLRTLVVGGGPTRMSNQVAIESNVRYVGRLLPATSHYRVLFADGNPKSANVQFRSGPQTLAYRAPDLPRQDGSADLPTVKAGLTTIAEEAWTQPHGEVLLYFTGHGSPNPKSAFADNWFDLWGSGRFTVSEFAKSLSAFPTSTPITIVMVQCFSG